MRRYKKIELRACLIVVGCPQVVGIAHKANLTDRAVASLIDGQSLVVGLFPCGGGTGGGIDSG